MIEVLIFYEVVKLLVVENGIGKVEGECDDVKLGMVMFKLFWKVDVVGGKFSYEVVW